MSQVKTCPIRGRKCMEHGYVHGREAEELRSGVEAIVERCDSYDPERVEDLLNDLQRLLDRVDAHDSLAWLESNSRKRSSK